MMKMEMSGSTFISESIPLTLMRMTICSPSIAITVSLMGMLVHETDSESETELAQDDLNLHVLAFYSVGLASILLNVFVIDLSFIEKQRKNQDSASSGLPYKWYQV